MDHYEPAVSRRGAPYPRRVHPIGVLTAATLATLVGTCAVAASGAGAGDWLTYNKNYEGSRFSNDLDGYLLAFDATTGKLLLTRKVGDPIGGGIVTYMSHGKQYVAVAAGMKNAIIKTESGPAAVVIYALPKSATQAATRTMP